MLKLFKWLDNNFLSILAGFLLIFIPLYPKLPLFDILPGYIVRVRIEDFLILFTSFVWFLWLLRGKLTLYKNPLLWPILAYLVIGLLSIISAIYISKTIPYENLHIIKIILHYLRRIEYFMLFFIFFSTVKSIRLVKIYIWIICFTVLSVIIYGLGQKYLFWPAFSTMNREFSKGWALYLTEHARVLSTFGGHYDLAAYIMIALVSLWSIFFGIKKWYLKLCLFMVIAGSFWILVLTASRISFLAYLFGLSFVILLWMFKKGIKWAVSSWFLVITLSILVMLSFGDLSDRYSKLFRVNERISRIKNLLLSPVVSTPKEKAIFLENNPRSKLIADIAARSDQPPIRRRPIDVYQDIPLYIPEATDSATPAAVLRTYSRNALIFDLSTAIRFDALWPQAIKGFQKNILLGSGYSTLNKTQFTEFTEAESTDNDYLRALGETGILGFITFFSILFFTVLYTWKNLFYIKDNLLFSSSIALIAFIMGLLVNAALIDVFEASKVALPFWATVGLILGGINITKTNPTERFSSIKLINFRQSISDIGNSLYKFIKSDYFILFIICSIAFVLRLYKINSPLADWHSFRQADTSAVTRNYVKSGINILYPTYDDLSNIQSGKNNPLGLRFVEFPLYNILSVIVDDLIIGFDIETKGRLTSVFSALGSIVFLYLIAKKYLGKIEAILTGILYSIIPYNIYFTRVILPEPLMVFTSLAMIYFLDVALDRWCQIKIDLANHKFKLSVKLLLKTILLIFLALLFTTSSILIKPFSAFLILPMIYLWIKKLGISIKSIFFMIIFFLISFIPFYLWRKWISQFPEGVPAYMWLLNEDSIRFKGAFFYWIFAERFSKLILGYWGLPLLIFGILFRNKKEGWLFYWWGISIILFLFIFATGSVRHDYYQVITIPIIVIFIAKGITSLIWLAGKSWVNITLNTIVIIIMIIFMEMFGWYQVRYFYNINHPEIVEAGAAVDKKTSDKALVIAPYFGDTAFLYQTRRAGWPTMQENVDKMIDMGADYYVSVQFDQLTNELIADATLPDPKKRKYKIIEQTPKYVIIQLVPDQLLRK